MNVNAPFCHPWRKANVPFFRHKSTVSALPVSIQSLFAISLVFWSPGNRKCGSAFWNMYMCSSTSSSSAIYFHNKNLIRFGKYSINSTDTVDHSKMLYTRVIPKIVSILIVTGRHLRFLNLPLGWISFQISYFSFFPLTLILISTFSCDSLVCSTKRHTQSSWSSDWDNQTIGLKNREFFLAQNTILLREKKSYLRLGFPPWWGVSAGISIHVCSMIFTNNVIVVMVMEV